MNKKQKESQMNQFQMIEMFVEILVPRMHIICAIHSNGKVQESSSYSVLVIFITILVIQKCSMLSIQRKDEFSAHIYIHKQTFVHTHT